MRLPRFHAIAMHRTLLIWLLTVSITPRLAAQGAGYWHTSGNRILDTNDKPVRIAGVNWYGFETATATPGGLYVQDYKNILLTVKAQGFNTVRIPFSSQMMESPGTTLNIAYSNPFGPINTELRGLNALQVLDRIVRYAGSVGLKIILDHHRSEAGNSAEASGLWFTDAYPESAWIADWTALADRYRGNSTVIGFDLQNEPHSVGGAGACWDCGGPNDWHLAAERAGNAVLAVNPDLLLFVEGTDNYNGDLYWWGGNLEGVQKSPVVLSVPNHLVYSAHDYGPHESAQPWFNGSTDYTSLSATWTKHWAYISQQNLAPVWLGEFGTTSSAADLEDSADGSQGQWFASLVQFLGNDPTLNWTYWALNGEDAYGYLDPSYSASPASATKASMLAGMESMAATAAAAPPAPTRLKATRASSTGIGLAWTILAGSGLTFAIFFGTSASQSDTLLANNVTATTYTASNLNPGTNYFFKVNSIRKGVASAPSNLAAVATGSALPPAAPGQLVAVPANSTQINLAWTPSTTPGATYTLYGGTNPTSLRNVVAVGLSSTSYLVTGLTPGTNYYFQVKAVTQSTDSAPSNIATAPTRPLPVLSEGPPAQNADEVVVASLIPGIGEATLTQSWNGSIMSESTNNGLSFQVTSTATPAARYSSIANCREGS